LHLARTVCRRAEREIVALAEREPNAVNPELVHYINRLSDLFFVLARHSNAKGAGDVLWVPGKSGQP
jgi:cob(I)alamin adenosyltransferase